MIRARTRPVTDAVLAALDLSAVDTGTAATAATSTDGIRGIFTENRYNALNARIANNAETGVWREVGVDASPTWRIRGVARG